MFLQYLVCLRQVSAVWFPSRQRPLSTSINAVSGPIGVLIIGSLVPQIVKHPWDVLTLNCIIAGMAIFSAAFTVIATGFSEPVLQDQPLMEIGDAYLGFKDGLLAAIRNKTYMLLVLSLGGGIGLFSCFWAILEQLLCPRGYDNQFVGLCLVIFIVSGVFFGILAGHLAGKIRDYELILKVISCSFGLFSIAFAVSSRFPNIAVLIGFILAGMGACGLIMYGIGLETAAETAFPASETTSAGLIGMSAMGQGAIYLLILQNLFRVQTPRDRQYSSCVIEGNTGITHDVTGAIVAFMLILTAQTVVLTLFVKPKYHRLSHEGDDVKEGEPVAPAEVAAPAESVERY